MLEFFKRKAINTQMEHKEELFNEVLQINIKRERALCAILGVFCIILLWLNTFVYESYKLDRYISKESIYIHMSLLIASIVFLLFTSKKNTWFLGNYKIMRIFHILIINFTLNMCSFIGINNQITNQRPFAYITAIFSIASILLLPTEERILTFLISYLIHIFGLFIVIKDIMIVIENCFYTAPLTVLAFIVSYINYSAYVNNFISGRIIQEKNAELDYMYKATNEILIKRTEELNEAIEMEGLRTNFFANISHELRTPLNVIFSTVQMLDYKLKGSGVHDRQKDVTQYISIIKQNCYRLIRLIANLIDITKIDAGYFHVQLGNHDIVKTVEDITLSVAKYIEGRNINLIFDTTREEWIIACDPDKIERIMLNLLSNAIKFTPSEGTIHVNVCEKADNMLISVKDTGIGVPDEMRDLIFHRFIQVDKTIARNREGSGIGLAIVKSLVEMHDGKIYLSPEKGRGSEFIVELPIRILPCSENIEQCELIMDNHNVEKINIEFSDIYF